VRALVIEDTDGPQSARVAEVPEPEAGPGEVRVALAVSALNHLDLWATRGIRGVEYRFPFILGADGAGVIDRVGSGVSDTRIGQEVVINPVLGCGHCRRCLVGERMLCREFAMLGEHRDGTHADYVAVPAACGVPTPTGIALADAAAGGVVYATAYRMLFTKARVLPGEVCLIHGIGGGLAIAALQLASTAGLECVVTSSSDHKLERARALGAVHTVNYRRGDLVADVRAAVGAVDVVIDSVGASTWPASLRLLGANGRLVNCGATSGNEAVIDIRHLFWRQLEVLGSTMASDAEFARALDLVARRGLRPVIDRTVRLEDAPAALLALEAASQFGKIVVTR
jgi:NADPH:quinone reductase-like Zn-dependent oxidoreductase